MQFPNPSQTAAFTRVNITALSPHGHADPGFSPPGVKWEKAFPAAALGAEFAKLRSRGAASSPVFP